MWRKASFKYNRQITPYMNRIANSCLPADTDSFIITVPPAPHSEGFKIGTAVNRTGSPSLSAPAACGVTGAPDPYHPLVKDLKRTPKNHFDGPWTGDMMEPSYE